MKLKRKAIFITGTDTNVGKTVATAVLGLLLQQKGYKVAVIKPVQCAGNDAAFLKEILGLQDPLSTINPFFAPEPLSPHLAFARQGKKILVDHIVRHCERLREECDVLLIEGAGGLMVPLKRGYYTADLIRDLNAELVIVSRLGLGTINHSLLTINQAKAYGLKINGIIFSHSKPKGQSLAEKTNPQEIRTLSRVKILGIIPYLKTITKEQILRRCQRIERPF